MINIRYFDLHCDTLSEIHKQHSTLYKNELHISQKRCCFDTYIQTFAVFIPDEIKGPSATEFFNIVADYSQRKGGLFTAADGQGHAAFDSAGAGVADPGGNIGAGNFALLSVENGSVLDGKLDNIAGLKARGVMMLGLTWNGENELGGGSAVQYTGLTDFGKQAVSELEHSGIVVDVSHLSDRAFDDVLRTATRPFVASHSNARSVCNHPRNLTDRMLKAVFDRGGLVGINFYPLFLGEGDVFERIYAHISHMLSLGGEHAVAMGGDFDGADMSDTLNSVDKVAEMVYYLQGRGFSDSLLSRVFFDNAYEFFSTVMTIL